MKINKILTITNFQRLLWTQHRDQANMNQYEINTGSKSKSVSNVVDSNVDASNPEYSYAYCEPIVKKIHQAPSPSVQGKAMNIPTSLSNNELCKTHKPGNSLRALLTKGFRKSSVSHPDERHTFTTHYGKKENIYEDVDKLQEGAKPKQSFSSESVGNVPIDEELKFVELQHNRVINELNLSIEELLMPSQSEADQLDFQRLYQLESLQLADDKELKFDRFKRPDPLFSTHIQYNPSFDIDSGISGSSSSATSYSGSVRYRSSLGSYSNKRNTTIYETPSKFHEKSPEKNVSPLHLMKDEAAAANLEAILPYTEQCSGFCFNASDRCGYDDSTNCTNQPGKRIETISEKVNLQNRMIRSKGVLHSTKCSVSSKKPQTSIGPNS